MLGVWLAFLLLLCPIASWFSAANHNSITTHSIYIQGHYQYEGVIFLAEHAPDLPALTELSHVDAYWTPTNEAIALAEAALYLEINRNAHYFNRDILQELPQYIRQYVGYAGGGWNWIYINGVCNEGRGFDWQDTFVAVDEANDCFFHALYNADLREIWQFQINGVDIEE